MKLPTEKQALLDTPIPTTQSGTPFDLVNTDYNIGAFKPVIASSRDARSTVANAVPKLDAKIAQVTGNAGTVDAPAQTEKTAKDVGLEGYTPATGVGSVYTSGDGSKWVFSNNGWVPEGSVNGASTPTTSQNGATPWNANQFGDLIKENLSERDKLEQERTTKNAEFMARLDVTQQALIKSIEQKYEARRLKMADINQRMLAGKTIAGAQSGRMRYAASMQEGVLTTEELDGQARLAEIDAEELSAIAQAKSTYDDKSYAAFIKNMDRLDELNREKMDTIQMLYEKGMEQDKLLYERRRAATEESRKTLDNISYSVSNEYQKLTTEGERKAFISAVAEKYALDPLEIYSRMMESADESTKRQLEQEAAKLTNEYKRETINTEKAQQANYYDQIRERRESTATGGGTEKNVAPLVQAETMLESGAKSSDGRVFNGRGANGYVDPYLYIEIYNGWETETEKVAFLKKFPPEDNIDPEFPISELPKAIQVKLGI